jgi:hypothetical protein
VKKKYEGLSDIQKFQAVNKTVDKFIN